MERNLKKETIESNISQIAKICDQLAEEVRKVKRTSLPHTNIANGRNYTSYNNLYTRLEELGITHTPDIKLYIRAQYEMLWKLPKFNGKVIPVNMMYSVAAVKRFTNFIEWKREKIGKKNLEKYLDSYVSTPLLKDINIASLRDDCSLVLEHLRGVYAQKNSIDPTDVIKAVMFIELGKIHSNNRNSVCSAYLYLNPHIDIDSALVQKYFPAKINDIKQTVKCRGISYTNSISNRKDMILKEITAPLTSRERITVLKFL